MTDFAVGDEGTVHIYTAVSEAAKAFVETLPLEDWQFVGHDAFVLDRGISEYFYQQLVADGFYVSAA
jgi:hypothetical protein